MSLYHSIRIMQREVHRAEQEHRRVKHLSQTEAAKVLQRIYELRTECVQLETLAETFDNTVNLLTLKSKNNLKTK